MNYKVTFTPAEWEAVEKWAEEECNKYANWIADEFDKPDKARWVEKIRARREVLLDIKKSLLDGEVVD